MGDADMGGAGGTSTGGSSSSSGGSPTGSGGSGGDVNGAQTILEIASGNADFSILVAAVTKAGLADELAGNNLTVFAPTNAAFAALLGALGLDSLDDLSAAQLKPILLYHVLGSVVDAETAIGLAEAGGEGAKVASLGGVFALSLDGTDLLVDAATVVTPDIIASNGIIHAIDSVLLPSITDIVTTDETMTGLKSLVVAADAGAGTPKLVGALDAAPAAGAWTLFAPDNAAVAAVNPAPTGQALTNVLLYHALAGATPVYAAAAQAFDNQSVETAYATHFISVDGGTAVTITDETDADSVVTVVDIYAENGVIHLIDGVLLPD